MYIHPCQIYKYFTSLMLTGICSLMSFCKAWGIISFVGLFLVCAIHFYLHSLISCVTGSKHCICLLDYSTSSIFLHRNLFMKNFSAFNSVQCLKTINRNVLASRLKYLQFLLSWVKQRMPYVTSDATLFLDTCVISARIFILSLL